MNKLIQLKSIKHVAVFALVLTLITGTVLAEGTTPRDAGTATSMRANDKNPDVKSLQPPVMANSLQYQPIIEEPPIYEPVIEEEEYEEEYIPSVQLLSWREVSAKMPQNTPIHVLDIRTGITYYIQSFSHGNHADVTPVSAEDTELMFQTFGRRWSWSVRPVVVTINGVRVAASINGQPHGGSSRSHINNMHGHICLHFHGSNVHNGNASFARLHQDKVMQAYNNG